jgi:glycosyltransferase involved in cell wall biosynthesis
MSLQFSIIIPTRNRADSLERCLTAIEQLSYDPSQFEVLIVDDGSTPRVKEMLDRRKNLLRFRVFRTEGLGPAQARNHALHHAHGNTVVFTDDDCRPCPTWLSAFEACITKHPQAGVGGKVLDAPENGIYGRTSQLIVSFLYEYANKLSGPKFFCSNNLAFPRQQLLDLGGFDVSFPLPAAEDRDLCARWLNQGELIYEPLAVVEHSQALQLHSFLRQHYRYGIGAFQFWQRRKSEGASGNKIEASRFYIDMVSYPFRTLVYRRAIAVSILIVISQIALATGYYVEMLRSHAWLERRK